MRNKFTMLTSLTPPGRAIKMKVIHIKDFLSYSIALVADLFSSKKSLLDAKKHGIQLFIYARSIAILAAITLSCKVSAQGADYTLIKGVVLSPTNQPVPNVSVSIEGSDLFPEITNDSGTFNVLSTSGSDWILVAPSADYKPKRIYLNNRTELTIYITPLDMESGDDPVSILSQTSPKRDIIASSSSLNTSRIYHSPALSIDQYLQGRIPGMFVVNRSGDPGSGAYSAIRGLNSLNTSNQPLYVIDGVPLTPPGVFGSNVAGYSYNPLMGLNLRDISKVTVVKDPVITAAYGSKGSNGIVFIETLDPSVTQTTIELDLRNGINFGQSRLIPQLDAEQHKSLMNELLFSTGLPEEELRLMYPSLYLEKDDPRYIDYQHNTNWQELIFKNSMFTNLNVNVKGGDEIARYGLSFGYNSNKGIIRNTGYQGYNLRFVSRLNIFTWLKMNAGVSLNSNSASLKDAATSKETSPIWTAMAKSPLLNPYQYDEEGRELTSLTEVDEIGVSNPLAVVNNYSATNKNYNFISTMDFESAIKKNLLFNTKFSLGYNVLKEEIFMPNHGMERYYNMEAINVAKDANNEIRTFFNNTYLRYDKSIGKEHYFSSVSGINIETNVYEYDWGLAKNLHESDQYHTLDAGQANLREIGGQNRMWNWISLYEHASYSYEDRFILSATVSLDGSSRVGKNAVKTIKLIGQPFGLFYSGGIAWRLSNESFLKDKSWLEDLKLRLTIGKSGNDDIGEASATNYYNSIKFRETVGLYPAVLPNDKLSYETVRQINGGIDVALLGNRFTASLDLFQSVTNNMLIFKPTDAFLGYDFQVENAGRMKNSGVELNTFYRVLDRNPLKWDVQFTFSTLKNEVTEIAGGSLITTITGGELVNKPGAPANSYYGYIYKGVYATQADATAANLVNDKAMPYMAGDAIYEDISGPDGTPDGVINNYDKTAIGSSMPKSYGGLINTVTYKRWTVSASLKYMLGRKIFNYLRYKNERMTDLSNQSQNVLNRWQYEGQSTDVPRALWNDPVGNSAFSTRWIENGSYLKLQNITVSYLIPKKFLAFRNAEFYISMYNLFTFTKYLGYDPEFSYSYSQMTQGVDYGQIPQVRQFLTGIKVGL